MANGFLRVQGQQINIPTGNINDGPTLIPYSTVADIVIIPFNATTTTAIPSGSQGVIITPNNTTAMTISAGFISGQISRINPHYPTIICFDSSSTPANLYITISNTANANAIVRFF